MDRRESIRQAAARIAEGEGLELVDMEFRREGAGWVLRLFIDKPGGVTLADCQDVSDQIGALIEAEDLIPHRYLLEVSSPGLDRVLRKESDFERFAGRRARVTMSRPIDGQRRFRGRLEGMSAAQVVLTTDDGTRRHLPLQEVAEARLEIDLEGFHTQPGRGRGDRGRSGHPPSPAGREQPAGNRGSESR